MTVASVINLHSRAWRALDPDEKIALGTEVGPVHPTLGTPCRFYTPGTGRYGRIGVDGKLEYVHRYVYTRDVGPIPPGCEVSHLCARTRCCAKDHLIAESHLDNVRRSPRLTTKCRNGHPWLPETTYRPPGRRGRTCRLCTTANTRIKTGSKISPWAPVRRCTEDACAWGHQWTPENTHIDSRGTRICRACRRLRMRRSRNGGVDRVDMPLRAQPSRKERCVHGHLLDDENTYVSSTGKRGCRACRRLRARRSRNGTRRGVAA